MDTCATADTPFALKRRELVSTVTILGSDKGRINWRIGTIFAIHYKYDRKSSLINLNKAARQKEVNYETLFMFRPISCYFRVAYRAYNQQCKAF
jgi:hypothetical protein